MKMPFLSTTLFFTCFIAFSQVKQLENDQEPGKGNVEELA
jgi:hypothetical protein